jgi:DNA-directed RNA polymerase specialized sigma24 family protein
MRMTGFEQNLQSILSTFASHCVQWPSTGSDLAIRDKVERYYGAVLRFLMTLVKKDDELAMELANEFAKRFLEGKYERFDPKRGRFRHYLKECLRNLVHDHWRKIQSRREQPLPDSQMLPPSALPSPALVDGQFAESFRTELISRTYAALAEFDKGNRTSHYTVMLVRTHEDNRAKSSAELVEPLSAKLGRPLTVVNVRMLVHRARMKFAELLVADVRFALGEATTEQLQQELCDLNLFDYCKPLLASS